MPKFIANVGVFAPSGEWGFEDHGPDATESRLVIPTGPLLPAVTIDDGQWFFIPQSGILAMTVGGTWLLKASGV